MKFRISNFEFRICRNAAGFTLIEVIIIIVIVSVFMAAVMVPLLASLRESDLPEKATIAFFLAQEKLEALTVMEYDSLVTQDTAGSAPQVGGFAEYTREVDVTNVDEDLNPSASDVGYKRITVKVFHSKFPAGISVETLRTDF